MLQLAERMGVLGTETAFEVLARANALAAAGRSIINLGIGQPDFPTPGHIVEAGRKALADGHHGYTPANGIPQLRAAVAADLYRRHRVEVSPELVLVVPGAKVTMFFAILMFGEPGAEILYPNPGFPIYESVIRFSGATPVAMPLHESCRLLVQRRRSVGQDHPAHPPDDHQQPGQSDGRGRAAARARPAGRRARAPPAGRRAERRDLRRDPLRRGRACQPPRLPVDPRPADPARRLEQDLRDDRLATRLRGMARAADRARRAPGDQLPFLRQRRCPIRRDRRAGGAARAGPTAWWPPLPSAAR